MCRQGQANYPIGQLRVIEAEAGGRTGCFAQLAVNSAQPPGYVAVAAFESTRRGGVMICWDKRGDGAVIGVLSREEIIVLRSYVDGVVRLAEYGLKSGVWITQGSDGVGTWVREGPVRDARIAAIVRDHLPEVTLDWEIAWHAQDCLSTSASAARRVASALPESGGVVALESVEDIEAWCRLIRDVLAVIVPHADGRPSEVQDAAARTSEWLETLWLGIRQMMPCRNA